MKWCLALIVSAILTIGGVFCVKALSDVEIFFLNFNKRLLKFDAKVSELAWKSMLEPTNIDLERQLEDVAANKMQFTNKMCEHMLSIKNEMDESQSRIYQLTCIGPKFENDNEQGKLLEVSSMIQYIYTTTKICIPEWMDICDDANKLWNFTYVQGVNGLKQISILNDEIYFLDVKVNENKIKCYSGEPQLEKIMDDDFNQLSSLTRKCKSEKSTIDYWIWEVWRHAIGPNIRELYPQLIELSNRGAQKGGFLNIGTLWQKEMEIDNVEDLMQKLLNEVQPFYNMLHAYVKSILEKRFAFTTSTSKLNMPAHLLGWNANWHHLLEDYVEIDGWHIDEILAARQWSSHDVVKRIEDFYTSLGLNRLSHDFWAKSKIEDNIGTSCHGTAANMYSENNFRVIVCGFKRLYDFYVITHEIGHIQQYMMAQHKPPSFQAGNSVIQETIGDAMFLGLMTPMHLNRLRLIDDSSLFPSFNNNFDLHQQLHMAMMKIPEIPSAYVFETFRYNLFAERFDMEQSNDYFWELTRKFQRIEPPNVSVNRHRLFDVAAKFHFAANVPYARYFFANILQYQIYRGLCEATLYGRVDGNQTLNMPLHKCDVYGSRRAGKLLKKALQNGSEWTFKKILKTLTGSEEISTNSLLEYYQPLIKWLKNYLDANNIEY